MRAILLLVDAGAFVDAIVWDGAAANQQMWKQFDVMGTLQAAKNNFDNPACEERNVFIFSDALHLIKCARNRLLKQEVFCVNGTRVFWSHYDKLYVEDTKVGGFLKICLKLAFSYLNPTYTKQVRVKLATQLLSFNVTIGLYFFFSRRTAGSITLNAELTSQCK